MPTGFYGGVLLRDAAVEGPGLAFGPTVSAWTRFAPAIADESSNRTLLFGGYRFRNDIAVEAAFNSADRYALRPRDEAPQRRGVGLDLASGTLAPADAASLALERRRLHELDLLSLGRALRAAGIRPGGGRARVRAFARRPRIGACATA